MSKSKSDAIKGMKDLKRTSSKPMIVKPFVPSNSEIPQVSMPKPPHNWGQQNPFRFLPIQGMSAPPHGNASNGNFPQVDKNKINYP